MKGKRFVDLSLPIETGLPSDPPMMIPKIDYIDHTQGAEQMKAFFPGVNAEQLPGGLGWAVEFLTLTTHSGTHLDAPYHYHPTMDKGKPSLTIDEIPLDWCFSNGVILDFRYKADGDRITAEDIEKELERINYKINPLDIVLIQTGADAAWGTPEYLTKGAGMDRESTLFLTEKGVKVWALMPGVGTGPCPSRLKNSRKPGTQGLSGKLTLLELKLDIVTWRSYLT
jgi:kynurenine formamidase